MSCDYCGKNFDTYSKGIYASGESGGVVVRIDGIEIHRGDELPMSFCSIRHFKKAESKIKVLYTQEDCFLKEK